MKTSNVFCASTVLLPALLFIPCHLLLAKDKPIHPPGDHLTPSPLCAWTDQGVMRGEKPDTQIIVSKTHVVLVTTGSLGFFDKKGNRLAVASTTDFFTNNKTRMPDGTLMSDFLVAHKGEKPVWGFGDCKALYDPYRNRFWFLATFNNAYPGDGQMFWAVGVSDSSDPTQGWRTFVLPAHRRDDKRYTNSDFPMLGLDKEAFYVSVCVLIGNPEVRAQNYWYVLALNADDVAAGKDLASVKTAELDHWPDPETHKPLARGILMPAIPTGLKETKSGMKFAGALGKNTGIWSLRNPFSLHPEIRTWTVPISSRGPGSAGVKQRQKGTPELAPIALGGAIVSVTQSGDDLYLVSQDVIQGADKHPHTAVRFSQVICPGPFGQPPRVTKDIKYGAQSPEERDANLNYTIPSAMINKNGDAIVVENSVGPSVHQEARASAIYHDSSSADWSALIKTGEGANTGGWGDIAKASLDPSDNIGIWVATQYGAGHHAHLAIGKFLSGQTSRISDGWPGLWANTVQAATVWPNGKLYFFRGSEYIRYDVASSKADPGYPQTIAKAWPGIWPEGFDAVAAWPNGKAYFFRGDQYLRYDIRTDKVDDGYPKPITYAWSGVWKDGKIDAVVVWPNGKAYFFRGDQYISYDIKADKADAGFPRPIANDWPGLWVDGVDAGVALPSGAVYFFKRSDVFRGKAAELPAAAP